MTRVGAGGGVVQRWCKTRRFHRDYEKLTIAQRDLVDAKLQDLVQPLRPPGLKFEKLKGHSNPDIYSIHADGNYKITMEIVGTLATLRRVGPHDDVDRAP